ncbi:MAG: precorrin-2 C(20)-methyltransferase [Pseudobutyrivibrio sp.]|nr:precorrin-2 C(20)-methyltransferase [Pseudobutyrivibrio sp.]
MNGILYGIGVGPGDPDLITLKAVKAIKECDVICLPKADKSQCRAYQIALPAVPALAYKKIISFDFEMIREKEDLMTLHQEFYESYKQLLLEGYNLGFLTIGDPTIYSTFGYIMKLAKRDNIDVEIISGVTAFCGSAAAVQEIICEGDENVHIISGDLNLDEELKMPGTKIIMKSGKNLTAIKDKLVSLESQEKISVYAVVDCGMETEQIYKNAITIPDDSRYMITIIVKDREHLG